jgi:dolichol-phosphate mannosyltransferase
MDVSIVVPTYKEGANLPVLVPQIDGAMHAAGRSYEIVVVDDDSPDDTVGVCDALARGFPVRLHVRKGERGLATAVIHGLRAARGEILAVMDADLSHPPDRLPDLVRPLREGRADFVIGSRYVVGGTTEEGWGLLRWLNSRFATCLAWPLTGAHDPLAGFFALRRETFEAAAPLDPVGYKIGLELMVKCHCRDVVEVPISFHNRLHGESKLNLREQINYLRHLGRLYRFWLRQPRVTRRQKPVALRRAG